MSEKPKEKIYELNVFYPGNLSTALVAFSQIRLQKENTPKSLYIDLTSDGKNFRITDEEPQRKEIFTKYIREDALGQRMRDLNQQGQRTTDIEES